MLHDRYLSALGVACTSREGVQRSTQALRLHDSHLSVSGVQIILMWAVGCICWSVYITALGSHEDTGWMMRLCRWVLGVSGSEEMQSNLMDEMRYTFTLCRVCDVRVIFIDAALGNPDAEGPPLVSMETYFFVEFPYFFSLISSYSGK
jgi:hypothetical protein